LNRASLWNSVELAETRRNARVAKEIQVTLPHELPPERRLALARSFSQEVADHYRVAVDLAVHEPRPAGDPRNHHAHLLLTTREVSPAGLGPKAGLEMSTAERARLGLPNMSQEFTALRERWATLTNEALKAANIEARVDHRSLAEQGVDREPRPHIPFAAHKIERSGKHSDVAASIRADYDVRVQERAARAAVASQAAYAAPNATAASASDPAPSTTTAPRAAAVQDPTAVPTPRTLEDIRREARANWLRLRAQRGAHSAATGATAASSKSAADDHQP
jgi:ATP-dependent exoDNAse (exonuclease V) alpha subunit